MNINEYNEKHKLGALKEAEWEQLAQRMLDAKFDKEKAAEWSKKLSERGIHRSPLSAGTVQGGRMRKIMSVAAVFVLLATATWFFLPGNNLQPEERLANNYLEQPFKLNPGTTRGDQSIEKNRGRALEAFNNEQYEKSLEYLQSVEAEGQAKAADYFQMGLCLMYQDKPDYQNALKTYALATKMDPEVYKDEIYWFSALCNIKIGNKQEAAVFLDKVLSSPSSRNQEEARKLKEALK